MIQWINRRTGLFTFNLLICTGNYRNIVAYITSTDDNWTNILSVFKECKQAPRCIFVHQAFSAGLNKIRDEASTEDVVGNDAENGFYDLWLHFDCLRFSCTH